MLSPPFAGPLYASAALSGLPFILAGGLEIVYDLLIWHTFRKAKLLGQNPRPNELKGIRAERGVKTTAGRPIDRASSDAPAFGTRVIVDALYNHGLPVNALAACGGLPEKNSRLMQSGTRRPVQTELKETPL